MNSKSWCTGYIDIMCRWLIRDKGINSSSLSKYRVSTLYCPSSAQYVEICSGKRQKAFANDLKSIYHAPNEESGYERMQSVTKMARKVS